MNGYQDEDGCPDEIPAKLKRFTGKVEGINFKTGSADILASSNKTLDDAAAVLNEFKDLKMEIQGHTDDEAFVARKGAKYQSNEELSQGRADAVRDYLVKKGVDPARLTAKGYGDAGADRRPEGSEGREAASRAHQEPPRRVQTDQPQDLSARSRDCNAGREVGVVIFGAHRVGSRRARSRSARDPRVPEVKTEADLFPARRRRPRRGRGVPAVSVVAPALSHRRRRAGVVGRRGARAVRERRHGPRRARERAWPGVKRVPP